MHKQSILNHHVLLMSCSRFFLVPEGEVKIEQILSIRNCTYKSIVHLMEGTIKKKDVVKRPGQMLYLNYLQIYN
jgi:hypothetical protein